MRAFDEMRTAGFMGGAFLLNAGTLGGFVPSRALASVSNSNARAFAGDSLALTRPGSIYGNARRSGSARHASRIEGLLSEYEPLERRP